MRQLPSWLFLESMRIFGSFLVLIDQPLSTPNQVDDKDLNGGVRSQDNSTLQKRSAWKVNFTFLTESFLCKLCLEQCWPFRMHYSIPRSCYKSISASFRCTPKRYFYFEKAWRILETLKRISASTATICDYHERTFWYIGRSTRPWQDKASCYPTKCSRIWFRKFLHRLVNLDPAKKGCHPVVLYYHSHSEVFFS